MIDPQIVILESSIFGNVGIANRIISDKLCRQMADKRQWLKTRRITKQQDDLMGRRDRIDESSMRMVDASSSVASSVASSVQVKRIVLSSS